MGSRRTLVKSARKRRTSTNMVAAAVDLAGGPTEVARLCGVARQSVYIWIAEGKVARLIDGVRLSRASGIPVEKFAGDELLEPAKVKRRRPRQRSKKTEEKLHHGVEDKAE